MMGQAERGIKKKLLRQADTSTFRVSWRQCAMTEIIIFALGMFTGAVTLAVLSCLAMGDDYVDSDQ